MTPKPETLSWIERLIAFESISSRSNLGLIAEIAAACEKQGCQTRLTKSGCGQKANLLATLPAVDGDWTGGLMLSGHSDVVPATGQKWTSNPFRADIRGSRLYGRGACDMKGFLGTALAMLPRYRRAALPFPVHYAISFDEEVGCLGAPLMIAEMTARGVSPRFCVVGEPTEMKAVVAHKAMRLVQCRVTGRAAHSSQTQRGMNAVHIAARIISFIEELGAEMAAGAVTQDFQPPYTTISVNQIKGGIAANTVPEECVFTFEYRALPGSNPEEPLQRINRFIAAELLPSIPGASGDTAVVLEELATVPSLAPGANAKLAALAATLTGAGIDAVSYGTEAGQFQAAGIPTIVCGPGSIRQAHGPDEFVELEQIARCDNFLEDLADRLMEDYPW